MTKTKTVFTEEQEVIYDQKPNLTPVAIGMAITDAMDVLKEHPPFKFTTYTTSNGSAKYQLRQIETLREYTIYFLRVWDRLNDRVMFEIDLTKVSYSTVLGLADSIRKIDAILEEFGNANRSGQLNLFRTFISRGDPEKSNKRMNDQLTERLADITNSWKLIEPTTPPPFERLFADNLMQAHAKIILKEIETKLTTKHPTLARQWSMGTLRDKSDTLLTRLLQVLGEFVARPFNGTMYQSHPTRNIGLMKMKDVMNLPFYSERIIIAEQVARFAVRPDLLPHLHDGRYSSIATQIADPKTVQINYHRFSIDMADFQVARFVTTGLPLYQVTYIPERCLACFFVQDSDLVIVVGHKHAGEENDQ